jgi:Ca-activated chloride channel family protein
MTRPLAALLTALLALTCLCPAGARADGFIIIYPPGPPHPHPPMPRPRPWVPPGHFEFAPLEVTYHRVTVTINDQVATTTVDQEFYNPNPQRLEGTYMFPLPPGAHIDKFSMDVNGKMTDAELLDAGKARAIYEDIVRRYKDPALLEYAGRDAFKARIFPIEPNSKKPIRITYTQLLKSDTGMLEYTYPLNTEKFSSRPLGDVSVKVSVTCSDPIKALYSPSHNVEIKRDGDRRATVGWEQRNVRPDTDFKLILSRTKAPIGVDLLTYRNGPDDGYFLLLASPGMEAPAKDVQARDVCFVLDTSGSMSESNGKKMEQAKRALSFCLQNLNDGDRFEIVRFSTEAEPFFKKLVPADKENVGKAIAYVQTLKPIGGTAIEDALEKALKTERPDSVGDRPYVVIFLTDGQPTIGETNEDALVAKVKKADDRGTRIFSFGIGTDVNTHLLDRVASETHSFSQYVLPEEDLEVKVSIFYTKIKEPVLANVKVDFAGENVRTSQLYPNVMPDLFKGEMLIAFGRYSGNGASAVKVTGTLNGERREFIQDVKFATQDTTNSFIPQLWATRRVGWLLDEIRLNGEKQELKDEVVKLAREHGIVTPYTAFLIMEDEQRRNVPVALRNLREFEQDAAAAPAARRKYDSARQEAADPRARAGEGAVANAKDIDELKSSWNQQQARAQGERLAKAPVAAAAPAGAAGDGQLGQGSAGAAPSTPAPAADSGPVGYKLARDYAQQSRVVNGRAFYQNGKTWTDSTAQQKQDLKRQEVAFNSDAYFDLLRQFPDAAQWFSLGEEVDVVINDTLYVVR